LVSGNYTIGSSIDAREVLVVTEAAQKDAILVGSWGIVLAANTIIDVLAVGGSVRTSRVASLQTENISTHEVVPLDSLGPGAVGKCLGEDETAEGVTAFISTVGVHFTSRVIGGVVDLGLVDETSYLDVVLGLHELNTSQGTLGDDTGAVVGLGAPGDRLIGRI